MDSSGVGIAQSQIAASILLVLYVAAVLVLLPRELGFLKTVKKPFRTQFIVLDILFQVMILLVLVPPILTKMELMSSWITFGIGFGGLWIVVIWLAISRYIYTYRYLITQHDQVKNEIAKLRQQAKMEGDQSE